MVEQRLGRRVSLRRSDGDPLALLVGLFDCALVLVLAVALHAQRTTHGAPADPVPAERRALPRFRRAEGEAHGDGARLGVAYQLADGQVVFVPESAQQSEGARK